jgi:hypothetical protein
MLLRSERIIRIKLKRQVRVILEKLCRRRQTAHFTEERSALRSVRLSAHAEVSASLSQIIA